MADTVRLVALQFMVSEKYLRATPEILQGVREVDPEPRDVRVERKVRDWTNQANHMTVDPTKRVAVSAFVYNLLFAGYVLVDAKRQVRRNDRDSWDHVFRFVFVKKEFVVPGEGLEERSAKLLAGLQVLSERNMWRAQAFRNPYLEKGTPVKGLASVDVNLKERESLLDENNRPLMVWAKGKAARQVGETKVQLNPDFTLAFADGDVRLLPFSV